MSKERKEIQRARMWKYFLDAATEVIEEEGIEKVTICKIADRAGYTASTAYNYFKDLTHLKFFAAMRFTTEYITELPDYLALGDNTIEKWLYSWECFCKHSFRQPEIYSVIFMEDLGILPQELVREYYEVYQTDIMGLPEEIQSIVMEQDFSKRSALYIQSAVDEGFLNEEDVDFIADLTLMIWKGMMSTYMNRRRSYTEEDVVKRTVQLVKESVMNIVMDRRKDEINYK